MFAPCELLSVRPQSTIIVYSPPERRTSLARPGCASFAVRDQDARMRIVAMTQEEREEAKKSEVCTNATRS